MSQAHSAPSLDEEARNERIHQAVPICYYPLRQVGDFLELRFSTISVVAKRVDETKKSQE